VKKYKFETIHYYIVEGEANSKKELIEKFYNGEFREEFNWYRINKSSIKVVL